MGAVDPAGLAGLGGEGADQARLLDDHAVGRQIEELDFYTLWSYAHPRAIELASRIASLAPEGLNRVFFTSGGSEAVESAIKLARSYHQRTGSPRKTKFITREVAYHEIVLETFATVFSRAHLCRKLVFIKREPRLGLARLSFARDVHFHALAHFDVPAHDLGFRFHVLLLFDPLANARNRLHRVAGVKPRCVQQMPVPVTSRKPRWIGQLSFAGDELRIHALRQLRCQAPA